MDAAATCFRSKKMWCLFEGGYHSKYVYTRIIVQILYSASLASQDNEACCFDSTVCGNPYTRQCWLEEDVSFSLNAHGVEWSLHLYRGSGHLQSFVSCLCICKCCRRAPGDYDVIPCGIYLRPLFSLLFLKCGVNSRAAITLGVAFIWANTIVYVYYEEKAVGKSFNIFL